MAFDTALSPTEETSYQAWKGRNAPNDSGDDYDLRGAFKAGVTPDAETHHWPDTYKKPNHPTFSAESIYAKDAPELAGSWDGQTYVPPKKNAGYIPDDQEASSLLDAVGEEEDPKRRGQMVDMLGRYRQAKAAKGEPLFQPDAQAQMKQDAALETLFSGVDKMDAGLEPGQRAALKVATDASADAPVAKARMANQAYVLAKWPQLADQVDADWTGVKHRVAQQLFGDDAEDIPEATLYAKIGGKLTKDKAERGMLTDVLAGVQFEAAKGNGDWLAAWKKASKGMTTNTGYTPANLDHYREAAKRVFADSQESIQELSPAIAAGKNYYRLATTGPATGTGKVGPDGRPVPKSSDEMAADGQELKTARATFMEELMRLPEDKRRNALNLAVAGAADIAPKPLGEEGDASFMEKGATALEDAIGAFPRNVGGFVKNASYAGAELSEQVALANSRPETRDMHWGALKSLRDDMARTEMDDGIDSGLSDAVDPIKSKNRLAQGMLGAIQSLPYMAAAAADPAVGIPLTLLAQSEDNRKQFVAAGVPAAEAATLAVASAAPMVAMDRLHANMVLKGTLPGMESWLTKAVGSKLALARKMLVTAGVEMTFQNVQQAVRNTTPAVYQEMASTLSDKVPGLHFDEEMAKFKKGGVDTFFTMLPMVLVGTGTATFKEAAFGRQYLSNKNVLVASGFTEEAAERISQTAARGDVQQAQALVQAGWEDEKVRPAAADEKAEKLRGEFNNEEQKAAFETLDQEQQEATRQIAEPAGARATRNEDGSWTVIDGNQQYVDQATTPEHAMGLVRDVDAADSKNLSGVVDDMIDYFKQRGTGAPIEKTGDMKFLQDKVDTGVMSQDAAERIVKLYADLGVLPKNTTPSEARIYGESAKLYNARTKLYDRIIRLHDGADPLTLIEEEAETYVHQSVAAGDFTHEDIDGWRRQVEGDFVPQKNAADRARSSIEWFSKYAQAYFTGKAPETAAIPFTVKRWLDKMKKVFADTFTLARSLIEQEGSGKLPEEFRTHLARSVGLDEAFIEKRGRDEARSEAYAPEASRYHAREAFERIKLPTPKAESSGMKGELANLWKSLPFDQRMKVFSGREGTLDSVAEALREDYGFKGIKTGDDVVQLAERVLLRKEDVFSDGTGEGTYDVRGAREDHVRVDDLPVKGKNYQVLPKGTEDPLARHWGNGKFLLSPDNRWVVVGEHDWGASEILGDNFQPAAGTVGGALNELEARGWVRVADTGSGKGDASPLYIGRTASPSQLRELKNVAIENGRTLSQSTGAGRERILYAPDESTLQLRKDQKLRDQTENMFKEEELPFNLHGEEVKDEVGSVVDRQTEAREAKRKEAAAQGDLWADSRAQPEKVMPVKKLADGAQLMGPTSFQIRAYHGTPHDVDKFKMEAIGTGEGAAAYGWGLYFAQVKDTAEAYRQGLSPVRLMIDGKRPTKVDVGDVYDPRSLAANLVARHGGVDQALRELDRYKDGGIEGPNDGKIRGEVEKLRGHDVKFEAGGNTYTVDLLPAGEDFLHWDKPLAEQSEKVKAAVAELAKSLPDAEMAQYLASRDQATGAAIYRGITAMFEDRDAGQKAASSELAKLGVPGIRYLDEGSRGRPPMLIDHKDHLRVMDSEGEVKNFPYTPGDEASRKAAQQLADARMAELEGERTHNFVLFDHDLVKIIERNGQPVVEQADQPRLGESDDATMQLRAQTRTPEFKAWFGESKVVDEAGEPLVVYHGTDADFSAFDPGLGEDIGIHFGTAKQASARAEKTLRNPNGGPRVMPTFLSIKNPLEIRDHRTWLTKKFVDELGAKLGKDDHYNHLMVLAEEAEDPEGASPDNESFREGLWDWLKEKGYDGLKYLNRYEGTTGGFRRDPSGMSYVVNDPTQIKSATGNRGTFDAGNPDITMQLRAGVIGSVSDDGSVKAERGDLAKESHGSLGVGINMGLGVTWRFSEKTGKVYWWNDPSEVQKDNVVARLEKMGYQVKGHADVLGADEQTFLDAHGGTTGEGNVTFDMRKGDDGELIAVHNTNAAKLAQMHELGGLAAPSVAIIKHGTSQFDSFGAISLIAPPAMVDPRASRKTKAFNADVYSPRFPNTEYKVSLPKLRGAWTKLGAASKELGGYTLSSQIDHNEVQKDGLRAFEESAVVRLAFLRSKGIEPAMVKNQVHAGPGKGYIADPTGANDPYQSGRSFQKQIEHGGLSDEFSMWVKQEFGNVVEGQRIRDYNEDTGNTRKLEYTLDNAVRVMKRGLRDGEGFNYGVGSIRSTVAKQFSSLRGMREEAGQIQSSAQVEKLKEETSNEFSDLATELAPYYNFDASRFGYLDQASQSFKELGQYNGAAKWAENFKNVPDELMTKVRTFMQKLANAPTEYFEAKVQRGVKMSEFAGAVIPDNASPETRQILKAHGLNTVEYKAGDSEARAAAVQSFGDQSFSIGRASRAEDVADAMRPRMIGLRVQASDVFADQVKQMLGQPEYAVRGMSVNEREARKIVADHGADLGRLMSTLSDPTQSMHPATKVALGFFVAEAANKAGDYRAATSAALWSAEYATSTGQAVNEFKRWSIFSNPETAQHLLQTQIEKENARRNERSPALAAVADTYAEVQKQARKLLKTWLDEINDVDATKVRPISRQAVGALPDVTFSLRPDILGTGIVTAVAKMLKQNGAEATEAALLERYGSGVEKHIPDILIEAQRELMNRKRPSGEKRSKTRIPELSSEQIEGTLASTRGKQETQLGLPNAEDLKARGMSDADIEKAMNEAGAKGSQSLADMPELYDKLLEHLMEKMKEKGISVPKGVYDQIGEVLNRQGLSATPDDVKRVIGARQLIPNMDPAQAEHLANLARNIASTPLGSFERSMQTMHLFSYVHDQIAPHDVADVAFGLWYANVLSGLVTSARNITGNASMLFLDQAAETIFRNPMTYFPYLGQLLKATKDSWEGSKAQGVNTMMRGQEGPIKSMSQGDERRQGVLESKTAPAEGLRAISRLATRSLSVQDLFFANTAFEMKARQLAWDQAKKESAMGRLKPEEIEARVDRLLNQATDQIQTFEDRAAAEWQNLDPEVRKDYEQVNWEKRRVKELQMFEREKSLVARAVDFAQRVTLDYEPEGLVGLLMTNLSRVFAAAEHAANDVQNTPGRLLSKSAAKFARTMILPFMRVPVNIFNRALDYGPVGYGRALMDAAGIPVLVGGSGKTRVRSADERSDLLKRATVGTLALLPLAILARPRGPDDDDGVIPWLQVHGAGSGNPQSNIALNGPKYRPYSLEIRSGGTRTFIDYRMFPLAPYLAAIGTMHDRTRYAKNKTLDEKSGLIQAWIIGQALKESMLSSSPITSLRELSEAAAENTPMSERSVNRVLARSTVGLASNMIPLSGLWRSLDQLAGGDRNTRDTLLSAAMAEIPVAGRLNRPSVDVLGDALTTRTGIGWLADWSKMETPESRIYATFARKGVTPADISRYQTKMTPEMYYDFAKTRGALLKEALTTPDVRGKTGLEYLNELSAKGRTEDDESPAKKYLLRMSRNATLRALAKVGFKPHSTATPEVPPP